MSKRGYITTEQYEKMKQERKYITLAEYNEQEQRVANLKELGVEFIYKKSKIKIALGCICLGIAVFPNGLGVIFYPLGFSLLISGGVDIYSIIKTSKHKIGFWLWKLKQRFADVF